MSASLKIGRDDDIGDDNELEDELDCPLTSSSNLLFIGATLEEEPEDKDELDELKGDDGDDDDKLEDELEDEDELEEELGE